MLSSGTSSFLGFGLGLWIGIGGGLFLGILNALLSFINIPTVSLRTVPDKGASTSLRNGIIMTIVAACIIGLPTGLIELGFEGGFIVLWLVLIKISATCLYLVWRAGVVSALGVALGAGVAGGFALPPCAVAGRDGRYWHSASRRRRLHLHPPLPPRILRLFRPVILSEAPMQPSSNSTFFSGVERSL